MKQRLCVIFSASIVMLVLGFTATPIFADDQSQTRAAIERLQSAKKSNAPVPLFQDAHKLLKNATGIKGSIRLEAQQLIKEATAEAQAGNKQKMEQKVNAAIAKIQKGVANAK